MSDFNHEELNSTFDVHSAHERGGATLRYSAAIAAGALVASVAFNFLSRGEEAQTVSVPRTEVYAVEGGLSTTVLTPVVGVDVVVKSVFDVWVPLVPDAESRYTLSATGDYDLAIDYAPAFVEKHDVVVMTEADAATRYEEEKNGTTLPNLGGHLAEIDISEVELGDADKLVIPVDRGSLTMRRPRLNSELNDQEFTVENQMITERDGETLEKPTPVFLEDGDYRIPKAERNGQDGNWADFYETILFGTKDINKDADDVREAAAQLAVGSPNCYETVVDGGVGVLMDDMVSTSFVMGLTQSNIGITESQIEVRFSGDWPTGDEIKDEHAETFESREAAFNDNLPGGIKIEIAESCDFKPEKIREES